MLIALLMLTIPLAGCLENGAEGPQGPSGPQGPPGADGADGADGMDGVNGTDGQDGADGMDGVNGTDGNNGADGAVGATGPQGPAGADGANGINGTSNMPINSIQDTDADIDVYSDSQIRIWFIDSGTPSDDEYGIEIFTHSSSGQVYAFQTITDATAGTPYRASLDLNSPSNQTLNYGIGPDHVVTLQLWMPENTSWGYYDITIIKSNSGYSNTPILCSVVHSTI